jgi:hypothetical protein
MGTTKWSRNCLPFRVHTCYLVRFMLLNSQYLFLCVVFCRSLFVFLIFFSFWSLYFLSFNSLPLIATLVFSNYSIIHVYRIHVIGLLCYNWRFANFWLEIWSHNWRFFIDVFDACFYCLLMFSFCLFQY